MKEYIDASLFLGMHSFAEKTRIACKNFFVKKLKSKKIISFHLEQIGLCDDVIWNYKTEDQDAYYPFMDLLHTEMNMNRIGYTKDDFQKSLEDFEIDNYSDKLLLSSVRNNNGILYSINTVFKRKTDNVFFIKGENEKELEFPQKLEVLYQKSLKLRIGISGIIPPLVTPLDNNGNVCKESVEALINYVQPYSNGLMPTLSSGEGWALSEQQFVDMLKYTIKFSNIPVLAGVEFKTTAEVIEKALIAKKLGVDAIVITTPFSKTISQEEIYNHFVKVDKMINLPLIIYNESEISGTEIQRNTIKNICNINNVIGIKEASGDVKFTNIIKNDTKYISVYQGWEHLCFESKNIDGYILPLSNIEPKLCRNMYFDPSEKMQKTINKFTKEYDLLGTQWFKVLKKELYKRGIINTDRTII